MSQRQSCCWCCSLPSASPLEEPRHAGLPALVAAQPEAVLSQAEVQVIEVCPCCIAMEDVTMQACLSSLPSQIPYSIFECLQRCYC